MLTIRVFYTGRDFFGGLQFDQEAAAEVRTAEDGAGIVARCLRAIGTAGAGSVDAFRIELENRMELYQYAGPGVVRITWIKDGMITGGGGVLMGRTEARKHAAGAIRAALQEVPAGA